MEHNHQKDKEEGVGFFGDEDDEGLFAIEHNKEVEEDDSELANDSRSRDGFALPSSSSMLQNPSIEEEKHPAGAVAVVSSSTSSSKEGSAVAAFNHNNNAATGGSQQQHQRQQQQEPMKEHIPQFHFSGTKAGMEQVDKARIERIVAEVSKGNPYYEHAARADQKVLEKAKLLREKAEKLTPKEISVAEIKVREKTIHFESLARKAIHRVIVCIDMDQFFVAVEVRDNPKLKGLPLAVGPSLISTASYEARKFGVRSAMPTFIAKKLCPELVTVKGRYEAYSEASKRAQSVFAEYDENFSMMSLDEAFLDITSKMNGLSLESDEGIALASKLVQEMREAVTRETGGLTCSAGIAANRMLAKICSEKNKPNGHYALKADYNQMCEFIQALPVRKVPGIGKASELLLSSAFDIKLVKDLWDKRLFIFKLLTPAIIDFYLRVPLCATEVDRPNSTKQTHVSTFFGFVGENRLLDGEEDDDGTGEIGRKSISLERTFRAIHTEKDLLEKLQTLSNSLAEEMAEKNIMGHGLTLKLKTDMFEVRSRGVNLRNSFGGRHHENAGAYIFTVLEPLLRQEMPISIRLMGIRASNLSRAGAGTNGVAILDARPAKRQPVIDQFLAPCSVQKSKSADVGDDDDDDLIEIVPAEEEHTKSKDDLVEKGDQVQTHLMQNNNVRDNKRIKSSSLSLDEFDSAKSSPSSSSSSSLLRPQHQHQHQVENGLEPRGKQEQHEGEFLICPICHRSFHTIKCFTNDQINAHVDSCLNRSVVAGLVSSSHHDSSEDGGPIDLCIDEDSRDTTAAAAATITRQSRKKVVPAATGPKIESYFVHTKSHSNGM